MREKRVEVSIENVSAELTSERRLRFCSSTCSSALCTEAGFGSVAGTGNAGSFSSSDDGCAEENALVLVEGSRCWHSEEEARIARRFCTLVRANALASGRITLVDDMMDYQVSF